MNDIVDRRLPRHLMCKPEQFLRGGEWQRFVTRQNVDLWLLLSGPTSCQKIGFQALPRLEVQDLLGNVVHRPVSRRRAISKPKVSGLAERRHLAGRKAGKMTSVDPSGLCSLRRSGRRDMPPGFCRSAAFSVVSPVGNISISIQPRDLIYIRQPFGGSGLCAERRASPCHGPEIELLNLW